MSNNKLNYCAICLTKSYCTIGQLGNRPCELYLGEEKENNEECKNSDTSVPTSVNKLHK